MKYRVTAAIAAVLAAAQSGAQVAPSPNAGAAGAGNAGARE